MNYPITQDEIDAAAIRILREDLQIRDDVPDADVLALCDTSLHAAGIRLDVAWRAFWHPIWHPVRDAVRRMLGADATR